EVVEADGLRHLVVGPGGGRGPDVAGTLLGGDRSFVLHPVEAPGSAGHELAGGEVDGAERLQRVVDLDGGAAFASHHPLDGVEQLGDGDGGRDLGVGEVVASRVGDHHVVAGRHQRVQEELAVHGPGVDDADDLWVGAQGVSV